MIFVTRKVCCFMVDLAAGAKYGHVKFIAIARPEHGEVASLWLEANISSCPNFQGVHLIFTPDFDRRLVYLVQSK